MNNPEKRQYLIARYGELILKSDFVRRQMSDRLARNIRDAFKKRGIRAEVVRHWANITVSVAPENIGEAEDILSKSFGVRTYSVVEERAYSSFEELIQLGAEYFRPRVVGKKFAVRAKKSGKLGFSPRRVEIELGSALYPHSAGVDLTNPQQTCYLEIHPRKVLLFSDKKRGPGGLPIGSEPPVLALVSGGFDSIIASWLMLRRGVPCHFLFFELGGPPHRAPVYSLLTHLYRDWISGYRPKLYVIPGEPIIKALNSSIPSKFRNLLLKRIFYLTAQALAERFELQGAVTGEAIAQVSSQTLSNLSALQSDLTIPIFRPLLTFDKEEIIELSRKIGTFDISASVKEYCAINPKKPATRSTPEKLRALESELPPDLIAQLLEGLQTVDVSEISQEDISTLQLYIDYIPENSYWIDLRENPSPPLRPPHLKIDLETLVENRPELDPNYTYLVYCEEGTRSLEVAYLLTELGYKAYSYIGKPPLES